ncbi:MAG: Gfo/Idh/MocA family oxidoreductase [Trueperaceae bacterium]
MSEIRIALIGAGGIAARHLDALARIGNVVPVGHLARSRASAERQARRYGGDAFDDVDALLDGARPDAVLITVPPAEHGAYEHACIDRGLPFLVEKPLSADADTAEHIATRLAETGLVAAVGYHWRALDTVPELRERLRERAPRLAIGAWHGDTPPPRWWRTRASSGGQMIEQATHLLDLARHLLGEATLLSAAENPTPPWAYDDADVAVASSATVRYGGGALGVFSATCTLAASTSVQIEFACDGLHVRMDQQGVRYDDGREIRTVRTGTDPFEVEDRAFLQAVRSGDPSSLPCDYADALGTHRLMHAIADAARADAAGVRQRGGVP